MLPQPMPKVPASFSSEGQHNSRVLQPKVSNIVPQQAGMYGTAFAAPAVISKVQCQPVQAMGSGAGTYASLSDTAEPQNIEENAGVASPVPQDNPLAHALSIPGQVDVDEHRSELLPVTFST